MIRRGNPGRDGRPGVCLLVLVPLCAMVGCGDVSEASEGPGAAGVLVDEDGEPLPWITVMGCMREICYFVDSDASGRFVIDLDEPATFLVKSEVGSPRAPGSGSPMVPVTVRGTEFVELGSVYVPARPQGVPLPDAAGGPMDIEVGDGLSLVLDPADLRMDIGPVPRELAARRFPESAIPAYPDVAPASIIAVYALYPFAATSLSPIGVRVASDLEQGTPVHFRTIDEIDGSLSDPVEGWATGDALVTGPGTGIDRLTHLVITR